MYQLKNKRWFPLQAATAPSLWASTTHSPQGLLSGQGYLGQQWAERGCNHREVDAQFCHSELCYFRLFLTSLGPHCLHLELCYFRLFLTLPGPTLPSLRTREHRSTAQSHCSDLRYSNHLQSLTGNFYDQVCSGIQRVVAFRKWIFDISER